MSFFSIKVSNLYHYIIEIVIVIINIVIVVIHLVIFVVIHLVIVVIHLVIVIIHLVIVIIIHLVIVIIVIIEAKANSRPYIMTFCGVNGVGKSTNLAKICFWLLGRC